MHLFNVLGAVALFLATAADGFGLGGSRGRGAAKRVQSSPLLDDALSAYPYQIKDDEKAKIVGNFNELARLYGDEEALQFVKLEPRSLKYKSENFAKCLDNWTEQFGDEKAKAMVKRNPGVLGIPPVMTDDAEATMAFSYLVAATRPSLPKVVGAALAVVVFGGWLHENGFDAYNVQL